MKKVRVITELCDKFKAVYHVFIMGFTISVPFEFVAGSVMNRRPL